MKNSLFGISKTIYKSLFYLYGCEKIVLIKIYYEIFQSCRGLICCTNIMHIYATILK